MAAECDNSTCLWICTDPAGCADGDGWGVLTDDCTGETGCGCVAPDTAADYLDQLATECLPGGTLDPEIVPCEGSCPPDDWRNTIDIEPWDTPTTTTSTTSAPCTGSCTWVFDRDALEFTLVTGSCSTGCDCYHPNFCPPEGCDIVTTQCSAGVPSDHGPQPNCTGTTSTTTTAAPSPSCTGSCSWKFYPVLGWALTSASPCGSTCPCPQPTGIADFCDETTTPCVTPTIPPCGGTCTYRYGDAGSGWILQNINCSTAANGCVCVPPSVPGSFCNQLSVIPCAGQVINPNPLPPPPPGVCTGVCYYCWSGEGWKFTQTNCTGCVCNEPPYDGTNAGEVGVTPCETGTTTTTTSTTTSPPCGGECVWECQYEDGCVIFDLDEYINPWTLISDIGCATETCGCIEPTFTAAYNSSLVLPCEVGGTTMPPTTTTTAEPCSQMCTWSCPEGFFCDGGFDTPWTLVANNCVGAPTCGCPTPIVLTSGEIDWPCSTACTGQCRWKCEVPGGCDDPFDWTLLADTCTQTTSGACECVNAPFGGAEDDIVDLPCEAQEPTTTTTTSTTTTSTTSTTTTTTTTTTEPCGTCSYECLNPGKSGTVWVQTSNDCTGGCVCAPPVGVCIEGATTSTDCDPPA